jgi:hypothetical protein
LLSTAIMVTRTRLNVTLYVLQIACLFLLESVAFTAPLGSPVTKLAVFCLVKLRVVIVGTFLDLSPSGWEHK